MAAASNRRTFLALSLFAVAYGYFWTYFNLGPWQPTVDLAWLVAVLAWLAAFWRPDTPSAPPLPQPWWFYALYVLAMAPFGPNWRWALTGDNLPWATIGLLTVEHGPQQTVLSANGPDNFGALEAHLQNIFMYAIAPSIFWHRIGKIFVGLACVAAIYTIFARLVRPVFGLLVAGCAASCSVWIVYTYASGPFINGLAAGYATLAVGLWVRRDPDSVRAWLLLGVLSGIALFLAPNGWFMAACVWTWLGVLTLIKGWNIGYPILGVATTLIIAAPMLQQWLSGQGRLFTLVQSPQGFPIEKVLRFTREAALFPFASQLSDSGAFGPQLPWGFRWVFVPSVLLTPLFPKRFFPGARFIFVFLVLTIASLAFAQGPYGGVSVKRALVLIPLATYFVFIPFHSLLTRLPVVLAVMAVWVALGVNDVVNNIKPGRTGYTLIDGALEAHQRFAPATVCMYVPGDGRAMALKEGTEINRLYGLSPRLHFVDDPNDPACAEVLCYCSQEQCKRLDLPALGYTVEPMYNTVELACGTRRKPGS
jgi:hypothetical protein